jgi:hypothetical protein
VISAGRKSPGSPQRGNVLRPNRRRQRGNAEARESDCPDEPLPSTRISTDIHPGLCRTSVGWQRLADSSFWLVQDAARKEAPAITIASTRSRRLLFTIGATGAAVQTPGCGYGRRPRFLDMRCGVKLWAARSAAAFVPAGGAQTSGSTAFHSLMRVMLKQRMSPFVVMTSAVGCGGRYGARYQ